MSTHWFREAASNSSSGKMSSSRLIAIVSGFTLSICTILLTVGSFWRVEMLPVLMAIAPSLAGMSGLGYAVNKWAGKGENDKAD